MARAIVNIPTSGHIGDVKSAMLTLAQFQAINGTQWVLADGSSAVGTKYATTTGNTTVPDLRGQVLRGKNNGRSDGNQNPDGDLALGAFQDHGFGSHSHGGSVNGSGDIPHSHTTTFQTWYQYSGGSPSSLDTGALNTGNFNKSSNNNSQSMNHVHTINADGGNETRMRNVTVNHFIKVN